MPDLTPNMGLKKPLGNENVSRAAYNENLDLIDQFVGQVDGNTSSIAALIGAASPTTGGTDTLFRYLKLISDYVDTLETKLGLNTDASGTSTVFARLAQIAGFTDTVETLIGTANPASGGTATVFQFLKQINDYVDTLEAQLGLKTDTPSGTGTLHAKVSNVTGNIGVHGDTNNSLHSKASTILSNVGVHGDTNNSLQGKIGSTTDLPTTNGSLHAKVNRLLENATAEGGYLGDWEVLPALPFYTSGKMIYANGYLFLLQGGQSLHFSRFNLSSKTFTRMADPPYFLEIGACMAWTGADYIYVLAGGGVGANRLYRYSISGNSWVTLANLPVAMGAGGAIVWTGGDFLFAFPGSTSNFYCYSISSNTWTNQAGTTTVTGGSFLSYLGGDLIYASQGGQAKLSAYSISKNSWSPTATSNFESELNPVAFNKGAAAAYTGGECLFCLHGGVTNYISRYSLTDRKWFLHITQLPGNVDEGGCLAYGQDGYLYATLGSSTAFYRAPIIATPNSKSWMR